MPVEAVIFDWGGTLSVHADVDLADMWRLAAKRIAPRSVKKTCARLAAIEAASFARVTTDQRSFTLAEILQQASTELGIDIAEVVLEEAATHYLDTWTPHIAHDPDAAPVLGALRAQGLRIGLLSNTHWPRAFHERFLARDGLDELIDVRVYTSEIGRMKPHPAAFKAALSGLGVSSPRAAVFVGDRLYDDVYGAKVLGMRAVHRRNPLVPAFDVVPDATVDRLPELLGLLEDWMMR